MSPLQKVRSSGFRVYHHPSFPRRAGPQSGLSTLRLPRLSNEFPLPREPPFSGGRKEGGRQGCLQALQNPQEPCVASRVQPQTGPWAEAPCTSPDAAAPTGTPTLALALLSQCQQQHRPRAGGRVTALLQRPPNLCRTCAAPPAFLAPVRIARFLRSTCAWTDSTQGSVACSRPSPHW